MSGVTISERADRLTELLSGAQIDALLITAPVNLRYLTGFTGTNGLAVVGADRRDFVTDFRYVEQAAAEVNSRFDRRTAAQELLDSLSESLPAGPVRLGFESEHLSVARHQRLRASLEDRVELVPTPGLLEGLRRVKDASEIERIKAAVKLGDEALQRVLRQGLVGRTEREVAISLEVTMRELGAQRPSFDTIVAAGPHGALPHAQPREVAIEAGTLVVIDWGAELDGYCSDCTRTVATGELDDEAREVYALVRAAQLTGLEAVRAGRGGREVDGLARSVIRLGGHEERFGHGLGHGVGVEVHEAPRLSQRSEDVLAAGNVVTVEPGVYLPGRFGVRIEDLVVVTETGADRLTRVSKELWTVR